VSLTATQNLLATKRIQQVFAIVNDFGFVNQKSFCNFFSWVTEAKAMDSNPKSETNEMEEELKYLISFLFQSRTTTAKDIVCCVCNMQRTASKSNEEPLLWEGKVQNIDDAKYNAYLWKLFTSNVTFIWLEWAD
jgi:hypothetical protein